MAGVVLPLVTQARTSASRDDNPSRASAAGSRRVAVSSRRRILSGGCEIKRTARRRPSRSTTSGRRTGGRASVRPRPRLVPLHPLAEARGEDVRPGGAAEVVSQPSLGPFRRASDASVSPHDEQGMAPRLDAPSHQGQVPAGPGHRFGVPLKVGQVRPEQVQAQTVALREVGPAAVEGDRRQLPLAKPQRARQRVVNLERAVELAVEASLPKGAGGDEVGEADRPRSRPCASGIG